MGPARCNAQTFTKSPVILIDNNFCFVLLRTRCGITGEQRVRRFTNLSRCANLLTLCTTFSSMCPAMACIFRCTARTGPSPRVLPCRYSGRVGSCGMMSNANLLIAASRLLAFFLTYLTGSFCLSPSTSSSEAFFFPNGFPIERLF